MAYTAISYTNVLPWPRWLSRIKMGAWVLKLCLSVCFFVCIYVCVCVCFGMCVCLRVWVWVVVSVCGFFFCESVHLLVSVCVWVCIETYCKTKDAEQTGIVYETNKDAQQ